MQIVFLFYEDMTTLDIIGPHEVLARLPGVTIKRVAKQSGPVKAGYGLELRAEYSFEDVSRADVLVVPGGGKAASLREDNETLAWIRAIHATTTWTTSVCTGSLILGASGILSGIRATSHWAVMDRLSEWGAIPTQARRVVDGKIITAAGVSAGIDMALFLADKLAGRREAETIQLGIEYDPDPPFNAGSPAKAAPDIVNTLRTHLLEKFESPRRS